jgi:hypothetical protein
MDVTGIGSVADLANTIVSRIWPDKTQAEKDEIAKVMAAMQYQAQANQGQMAVNAAAAAKQPITFRDGAGWVCVAGFAVTVLRPMISWGTILAGHPVNLPAMDMTEIMPMLMALLGLGGMHLYEATKP